MNITRENLLPGVYLTHIGTDKFKIASLSISFLAQLRRETAPGNALIPNVLCRGSTHYDDMEKLSRRCDELYGTAISPLVRRIGEIQTLGITASFPESVFLPGGENVTQDVIALMSEILLEPSTRGGLLREDYVNSERDKLAEAIRSRINNKAQYSLIRCIEEMCCFEDYAVARLGNLEECREIRYRKLTRQYQQVLSSSPVEICYCGREAPEKIAECLRSALSTLPRGEIDYEIGTDVRMNAVEDDVRRVTETMDVNQARLVMGFRLGEVMEEPDRATLSMFNTVFGSGVTSKLFVHVRERLQLCYSVASIVDVHKGTLFAAAGIDASKASEAEAEILHQLQEVRDGNITDEELEYAKAGILSDLTAMLDSPGAMESFFFSNAIDGSDLTPEEYAVRVREVTKEDVSAVAKSIVPDLFYLLRGEDK